VAPAHTLWRSTVMSQPQSPTSEHLSSPLDVHDDNPQQRSAISDTARQERLAALERRRNRSATDPTHDDTLAKQDPQPFDANHAKRTEFRRLVDPGIMRPNSKEVALRSLHVNIFKLDYRKHDGFFFPFFLSDSCRIASHQPGPCRRYLQSQRICFASLTIPSFVSSNRRIRSSSGIS
jgi:hypothetical protein